MRIFSFLLALCLLSALLFPAIIQGEVYDSDTLDLADKALVSINTVPMQIQVAAQGVYSFQVQNGDYTITAKKYVDGAVALETSSEVEVVDNGTYSIDLLLFPQADYYEPETPGLAEDNLSSGILPEQAVERTPGQTVDSIQKDTLIPGLILLAIALVILYFFFKSQGRGKEAPAPKQAKKGAARARPQKILVLTAEQKQVMTIIKKSGGFASQKEIRKGMPHSEAKVSLIITELEEMGAVKRFKRGRGNLVKLLK